MGDVAAALANWNGLDFLPQCLQSLTEQSHPPSQIVVVDNGSTDGSKEWIRQNYPQVELIENDRNLGFSAGYNRAVSVCDSEYILILNTDVFLDSGFVAAGLSVLKEAPDAGAATGLIYQEATREELNGGFFMRHLLRIQPSTNQSANEEVFGCTGSVQLCRRQMLDAINLEGEVFDGDFFAYCEDVDMAWRAQLLGWRALFTPLARAYHVGSGSLGGQLRFVTKPQRFQRHVIKNRYLTLIKNAAARRVFLSLPTLILADLLMWLYLILRSPTRVPLLMQAYGEVLRLLPAAMRKRKKIQVSRTVAESHIRQFFRGWF